MQLIVLALSLLHRHAQANLGSREKKFHYHIHKRILNWSDMLITFSNLYIYIYNILSSSGKVIVGHNTIFLFYTNILLLYFSILILLAILWLEIVLLRK
jgi:hypothetical protein